MHYAIIIPYFLVTFPMGAIIAHGLITTQRDLQAGLYYIGTGLLGMCGVIMLILAKP